MLSKLPRVMMTNRVNAVVGSIIKEENKYLQIVNHPGIELDSEDFVTVEYITLSKDEYREYILKRLLEN